MKKKPNKKKVQFIDVTTRDGSYLVNFNISPEQTATLADYLDYAGLEYMEVGHGGGIGSFRLGYNPRYKDIDYILQAKKVAKNIKIGVLAPALSLVIPDLEELVPHIDFVRVGTMPKEVEKALPLIEIAKNQGLQVFVNLTRASALSPKQVAQEALKAQKMGADVVYLVDSMGSFTHKTIKEYVKAIVDKIDVPLGFHGHNNLGMANINSILAVEEGCRWVDATILGVGRQAGNAQLETLALLLRREGFQHSIKFPFLLNVAETLVAPIFKSSFKGIEPFDLWSAFYNLDLYPATLYQRLAFELGIDIKDLVVEISKMKDFIMLDDKHLKALIKKSGRNYSEVIQALQTRSV